jgi:hypothetical protein
MKILLERKSPSVSSIMAKLSADWPFCDINCDNITGIFFKIALIEKTGRFEINQANYAFVV